MEDILIKFRDAAAMLNISLRQFRRIVDGGQIPVVRVSDRAPRIRESDLKAFIDARIVRYKMPVII
jgi:excisionase family DNA binding protein